MTIKEKTEPKKPAGPHTNNLTIAALQFCCGGSELGNFNYIDRPDDKKMTHYHKKGGWTSSPNAQDDPTTLDDIRKKVAEVYSALLICTTGSGQTYVEPYLEEVGFKHVFTFVNPGHANTDVKLWVRAKTK